MQEKKKGSFWLYKGDERVTGLYGAFCQFTGEPKVYTLTEEQYDIILGNLAHKIKRMHGMTAVPKSMSLIDDLTLLADAVGAELEFDNVRVYTTEGEHLSTHEIVVGKQDVNFHDIVKCA